MAKKTNTESMDKLFDAVAEELTDRIVGIEDEDGNIIRPSIQDLNAAIKFLQNNDITADITNKKPLDLLNKKVINLRDFKNDKDNEEDYLPERTTQ